ncbi:hypothetical protein [Bradyrhizobium roseum]|uniref:hypothetical protein n=1 Tax=Bradyrhizobium roseum TaxID=3056648 RepID=UPI00263003BE|nr:hypothetical protein [Bradyrhizobium roseus]WKA31627.1 hypothetical protein QUH67_16335 [Bradyrhizobium roseus]
MTTLPRIELSDHHRSPFDEAVLIVDGREEHTITIECENALDLAHHLILYVNAHDQVVETLKAAMHALRSYQFGNSAPDLAQGIADDLEALIKQAGEAA